MGDVYASAAGTTVMQIKEIPPCPAEMAGALCLFDLKEGLEAEVREALGHFGEIESVWRESATVSVVRFTTHAAALKAKSHTFSEPLWDGIDTQYNERSYGGRRGEEGRADDSGRGWCVVPPPRPLFFSAARCPARLHPRLPSSHP